MRRTSFCNEMAKSGGMGVWPKWPGTSAKWPGKCLLVSGVNWNGWTRVNNLWVAVSKTMGCVRISLYRFTVWWESQTCRERVKQAPCRPRGGDGVGHRNGTARTCNMAAFVFVPVFKGADHVSWHSSLLCLWELALRAARTARMAVVILQLSSVWMKVCSADNISWKHWLWDIVVLGSCVLGSCLEHTLLHFQGSIVKISLYLEVVLSGHNQLALRKRVWNVYNR